MTHTYELTAITRLQSIETAERYLIARTRAEIMPWPVRALPQQCTGLCGQLA